MNAYIAVADFELHMEDYHDLRVNVLNHQLSGVAANRRDLNLFLNYLNAKGLKMITGEEMLKFMGWLREERDNMVYRTCLINAATLHALFVSKKGNRLAVRTAQDNFKKIVGKAGPFSIEKVTPHSLRHAFATHAIAKSGDHMTCLDFFCIFKYQITGSQTQRCLCCNGTR